MNHGDLWSPIFKKTKSETKKMLHFQLLCKTEQWSNIIYPEHKWLFSFTLLCSLPFPLPGWKDSKLAVFACVWAILNTFPFLSYFKTFYWSIVALHCCLNFYCMYHKVSQLQLHIRLCCWKPLSSWSFVRTAVVNQYISQVAKLQLRLLPKVCFTKKMRDLDTGQFLDL